VVALELLDRCRHWPHDKDQIRDAGLCHGALGVAHIFNRVYQADGDDRWREAAIAWYRRGLSMRQTGSGIGFTAWVFDRTVQPDPTPLFLAGAPGVALALLAGATSVEPAWDRLMSLSGRQRPA